ncbi:hypothetical protein M885DRAFT_587947 [Pelagophyceae sp. CCMP2097]|nr:hypothetical protein M885DRAFT_587947 [Pelagophyceae sp. CCMP2097]
MTFNFPRVSSKESPETRYRSDVESTPVGGLRSMPRGAVAPPAAMVAASPPPSPRPPPRQTSPRPQSQQASPRPQSPLSPLSPLLPQSPQSPQAPQTSQAPRTSPRPQPTRPVEDRAFGPARLALDTLGAKLAAAGSWHPDALAALRPAEAALKRLLDERKDRARGRVAELRDFARTSGDDDRDAYAAAKRDADLEEGPSLDTFVAREARIFSGGQVRQITGDVAMLYTHAAEVLPGFNECMASILPNAAGAARAPSGSPRAPPSSPRAPMKPMSRAAEDVALRTAPLKALSRCVEKAAAAPSGACSIVDVVRCAFVCESKAAMARAFNALAYCDQLVVVRGEDRWANPTARGWADILLNVRLASDPHRHLCEVLIVHASLLEARDCTEGAGGAGPGGSDAYADGRAVLETLARLGSGRGVGQLLERTPSTGRLLERRPSVQNLMETPQHAAAAAAAAIAAVAAAAAEAAVAESSPTRRGRVQPDGAVVTTQPPRSAASPLGRRFLGAKVGVEGMDGSSGKPTSAEDVEGWWCLWFASALPCVQCCVLQRLRSVGHDRLLSNGIALFAGIVPLHLREHRTRRPHSNAFVRDFLETDCQADPSNVYVLDSPTCNASCSDRGACLVVSIKLC